MIRLLKYVSFIKVLNLLKVYLSYYISVLLKKPFWLGYPFSLTTEPTNLCNLSCIECPTGNKSSHVSKGSMDFTTYKKIIDDVKKFIFYQMLYFQGEPFLNRDLFDMISYSDENRIYTSLSTNGHFIDYQNSERIVLSGLKEIIISVDGTSQDVYEKYRVGGNLSKVIEGVKNLQNAKNTLKSYYPIIKIQFLVFKHNEHQINEMKNLSKKLKVDKLEFKSAQIYNHKNIDYLPTQNKFARYKVQNNILQLKNKMKNKCFRIWSTLVIEWSGKVIPCCFDKSNQYILGNIHHENALQLWKSTKFMEFRSQLLKNRKQIGICSNCTEGTNT